MEASVEDPVAYRSPRSLEADASASLAEVLARHNDRDLLDLIQQSQAEENRCRARRMLAVEEFHRRREAEHHDSDEVTHFLLTPAQETGAEISPLLGVSEVTIDMYIKTVRSLRQHFPGVWAMCESGRLDLWRAQLVLAGMESLAKEADLVAYSGLIDEFLAKFDEPDTPLLTLTRTQLQRAVRYRKLKFEQRSAEETFFAAYQKRRVRLDLMDNGTGHLGVSGMVTDAMAADYRLTLIAKKLCEGDETRTLEQMRADVGIDLLLGRLCVGASSGELEDDETYDGRETDELVNWRSIGAYARPIINVTVPIQTLMGLSDEPGLLSGGNPIPPDVARMIAMDPQSTWYRMLTDAARNCAELSTESYVPTKPIWRQSVAEHQTCIYPTCSRPAVQVELDHRIEHPAGATCTENLAPLCKRHHKVKHSRGFELTRHADGSFRLITKAGSVFRVPPQEQPVAGWPEPEGSDTERLDRESLLPV